MQRSTLGVVAWREIRWTEESEEHIARHEVTPDEVEQVVNTHPRLTKTGRGGTELIYGTTDAGRYLLIVVSEALDGLDFIVTARDMDLDEQQEFRRQAR
jgi:hypothetical protein